MKKQRTKKADDPTTAAELHALVELWPEEARPRDLYYSPSRSGEIDFFYLSDQQNYAGPCILPLAHAIDLHVASGIKWLIRNDHNIKISKMTSGRHTVVSPDSQRHSAPTLLLALHAAIMATKGDAYPHP